MTVGLMQRIETLFPTLLHALMDESTDVAKLAIQLLAVLSTGILTTTILSNQT